MPHTLVSALLFLFPLTFTRSLHLTIACYIIAVFVRLDGLGRCHRWKCPIDFVSQS